MAGSERDKAALHSFVLHSPFCQRFLAKPYSKPEVKGAEGVWLLHAKLLQLPGAQIGQGRTVIDRRWMEANQQNQPVPAWAYAD